MAKNREKQKAHKKSPIPREERIAQETAERLEAISELENELSALKAEELDARNYYGLTDPTPREAVKRILRPEMSRVMNELRRLNGLCVQAG